MDLKKTIACCAVLVWAHVCLNIVLIRHALGAKIVQEQDYGLGHLQTFTLLTGLGTSENFTTPVANLSDKSVLLRTQPATIHSLCSSVGSLWIEYMEPNFKSRRQSGSSVKPYYFGNDLSCRPLSEGERIPASVKYLGNSRLNKPGLSLFSEENFDGEELYFDGTRLMYTFVFKSYGFTGPSSWSIYSGGNFSGDITCLDKRYDLAITMDEKVEHGIGSVQIGCQQQKLNAELDDEASPALLLYYNHMRLGNLETFQLYFDGNELRLPFSRSFHAFSIVGPAPAPNRARILTSMHGDIEAEVLRVNSSRSVDYHPQIEPGVTQFDDSLELSWTIYSGINFDGHSKCLSSAKAVIGSTNQFKEMNNRHDIHLMIGSIRTGCEKKVSTYNLSQMQNLGSSSIKISNPYSTFVLYFLWILCLNYVVGPCR